jgi:heat shock protein HslJ
MVMKRTRFLLACCASTSVLCGASHAQDRFPFDGEMILDAAPMPGSKRIPNMDVAANGAIALEMWCNRVEGQIIVAANTITVVTGPATNRQCPPERARGDDELLAALNEVTTWSRQGSMVTLIGPKSLRFRVPSN